MREVLILAAQVFALVALNETGYALARFAHLPLPGNLIGMLLLLALLGCRIVRLSWFDSAASVLLSHLAFFFIPIAVGLVAFTDVLQRDGLSWLVTLVVAAAVGIVAAGVTTQAFSARVPAARGRVPARE